MNEEQFDRAMYLLEAAVSDTERYAALAIGIMLLLCEARDRTTQEKAPDLSDRG